MIWRVVLGWVALSGAFFLGWFGGLRNHLQECDRERVELTRALFQRDQEIATLKRQRERDGS